MKRILLATLLVALLMGCGAESPPETTLAPETTAVEPILETREETLPEPTGEPEEQWDFTAEEISVRADLDGADLTENLTDRDRSTRNLLGHGMTLKIESDRPFSALYLEWDAVPGPYLLHWDGGTAECGAGEFQHDYVRLPETVTSVRFELPGYRSSILCEVRAFTEGAAPEGVQDWRAPCKQADVLVFPTHADDDTLFFGALMSYYAIEKKLDVQTAFMTRHYDDPERCHERLDGLWEMGIHHYPILSDAPDLFTDSLTEARLLYAPYDILGWQVRQIRRFRPQVIVGHDLKGEYGHGGHRLNAHSLVQAVELAAEETACPDSAEVYGLWDTPKLYLHLYPENQVAVDVKQVLENDPRGRTALQIAADAYACHESQQWCDFRVNTDDPKQNCVYFGLYRSLVGPDSGGDIMDNIGYG